MKSELNKIQDNEYALAQKFVKIGVPQKRKTPTGHRNPKHDTGENIRCAYCSAVAQIIFVNPCLWLWVWLLLLRLPFKQWKHFPSFSASPPTTDTEGRGGTASRQGLPSFPASSGSFPGHFSSFSGSGSFPGSSGSFPGPSSSFTGSSGSFPTPSFSHTPPSCSAYPAALPPEDLRPFLGVPSGIEVVLNGETLTLSQPRAA
ncbi:hypothetical protein Pcinc_005550 [Petrolisthes cinctipes]|uniref:Uncharacterized protein n=1 Tax=Petrolisthes cinctipes TaxID=88211 RepID=A0AAE1L2I8_PETCI|nr:hypothetical protein Pcinc_005550 [Petrolisthes cinctipes]